MPTNSDSWITPLLLQVGSKLIRFESAPDGTGAAENVPARQKLGDDVIGWRNIIEHIHQNATVAKWYKENGRHEIFAGGKEVEMADPSHGMKLNAVDLERPHKPQMDGPKTAAEEMQMMRKLYAQMVLDKQNIKGDAPVQIGGLSRKKKEAATV